MLNELCRETNTKPKDWEEIDGMETGVGIERWYYNEDLNLTAYCVDDQGEISISISDDFDSDALDVYDR